MRNAKERDSTLNRPLRILYVDQNSELGGGQLALVQLLREIDRNRVEPIVVLGRPGGVEEDIRELATTHILFLDEAVQNLKWERQGFLLPLLALKACISITRYIFRLRQVIRQEHIDVIHGNSIKACILAGIAARLSSTPVIWHIRSRIAKDSMPLPAVVIGRFLLRVIPHFVIANSHATLAILKLPASKPQGVVYSTINAQALKDAAQGCSNFVAAIEAGAEIRFGIIGRIIPWKGQDIFVRAAATVHGLVPGTKFFVIGSASKDEESIAYEKQVRQVAESLKLKPDVLVFTGFQKEIHLAIAQLHVVVNPSTKPEPIAQVAAQALLAGKVVIASAGGGTPEIISHGQTGLLVSPGSPEALSEAMLKVLSDPVTAQAMADRGNEQASTMFCPKRIAKEVEEIYLKVANYKEYDVPQRTTTRQRKAA